MRTYALLLGVLAALWGSSFLFIKVAVEAIEPTTVATLRVTVAAGTLVCYLAVRGELRALRRAPRGTFALGIVNAAIPFTLIAVGQQYVDSGTAAVANAGVPLFVAVVAFWLGHAERATGRRLVGVLIGLVGVAWLVMFSPVVTWPVVLGTMLICAAALSFALGALYGQHLAVRTSGPVVATAAYLGASVALLPLGVASAPTAWPGWGPVGAVVALAIGGTAVGQLLWFALLTRSGSARASLVTYVVPVFALGYGAAFASEDIGVDKLGALVLILVGVALASRRPTRPIDVPELGNLDVRPGRAQ